MKIVILGSAISTMKILLQFQGVIKGRGGLVLCPIISCALFYLYFKKNRLRRLSLTPSLPLELVTVSSVAHGISECTDLSEFGFDMAKSDPYDKDINPNGIMQLGVAVNLLCSDLIEQWVARNWNHSIGSNGEGIKGIVPYQPFDGLMDLKMAMSNFMSKVMGNIDIDPLQLVLTSGATPAIEILAFCLGNPGDAFLIPAPYYPGDLERTGVALIPVHSHSSDNFTLSIAALKQAYSRAINQGSKVRGILLSNPSNPVGNLLPKKMLESLLDFAREKNIHIVSDEIFAGSVHGNSEFISMAEIVKENEIDKNRVHIIYGISKDLSLAGFRVGSIYTFNENVLKAAKRMTRFCSISTPTQRLLITMLSDEVFIKEYMKTYKKKLKLMNSLLVESLRQVGIRCCNSDAGLFCWADMSALINPDNPKGEMELWDKMMRVGKLFILPGSDFHCIEPGWFRCCFCALSENDVPLVIERIQRVCDK
ncbi:1-aminocyclopropane-1-carboxylate synthase 6-like isoform X2 [Silene latifolia]|uniref:1-aminocyclopropane-1-carboxylate synthase 6-like isoform X2 n=1 Tax=Silene latifolia TaxID=37657 RepID=UPI003D780049